jgi:sirohydrochlorin ferrochelatase
MHCGVSQSTTCNRPDGGWTPPGYAVCAWCENEDATVKHILLLVAHGSRSILSNQEIKVLCQQLARKVDGQFAGVRYAFLELAEPEFADVLDASVQDGADRITVLPYFLAAGRHVVEDLPRIVSRKRMEHPHVDIRVTPYLGQDEAVADILVQLAVGD